jgi:ABC-type multidrug transport system fused ATPase/permease subunit
VPKHFIEMFSVAGLMVAVIIKLLYGYKDADVFVAQLAVFAAAAFRLLPSVGRINEHSAHFLYALPSIELIYNDLKAVAEIPPDEKSCDLEWKFTDTIKIHNVRYRYPDTDEYVIDGAQFEIKKGTMVAFIGTTGAGKTTMADIIIGLLAPEYGRVIADNLDIHKNLSTWHKEIGYIPQTIYLSDDTIRHNVAFGLASEHIDEQAVVAALEKAQLYKFVEGLPDGLDTYVGDRGIRLSGGQRQRIGIARALYHNPEILVLDEATAALDSETEAAVMEAIESLHGEKTMIVIAHRLSTIKDVDMVYEIEGGKVIAK